MSAKHEVHTPSNARIIKILLSFHGNKVSMTASTTSSLYAINSQPMKVYFCCHGYKVHTPSNARIIKILLSFHGNKVSMTASTTSSLYAINSQPMKVYFCCHGYKVSIVTGYNIYCCYFSGNSTAMLKQYASVAMVKKFCSNS